MRILILGAGAGGGLPQWNCGCPQCAAARAGTIPAMTQSSIAVSANGSDWVLLNASPDLRQQFADNPSMHPAGLRGTPVKAVVLTNGDVDHIAGLLTLREKTAFNLYATRATHDVLDANAVFNVLDRELVARKTIALNQPFAPVDGLTITPYAVPGKVPLYLEGAEADLDLKAMGEQTVGLRISANGKTMHYLPGCAEVPDWLLDRLTEADAVLFDGTTWTDDEMIRSGTGKKTGARMGHMPMTVTLERLAPLRGKRLFTHINNTNPALLPDGPERAAILAAGWDIAQDGTEITL